jgi:hypothetical protein
MNRSRPPVTHATDSSASALAESPDSTAPDVHLEDVGAISVTASFPDEDAAHGGGFPWY